MTLVVAQTLVLLAALGQGEVPRKAAAAPAIFEGVVRGPGGKPVAKAAVQVWAQAKPGADPVTVSGETDAAGRFRLQLEGPAPYRVRVEAAGLAHEILTDVKPGPLAVTLVRGVVLEGTVKDGSTGEPVAGVEVRAQETLVWARARET